MANLIGEIEHVDFLNWDPVPLEPYLVMGLIIDSVVTISCFRYRCLMASLLANQQQFEPVANAQLQVVGVVQAHIRLKAMTSIEL